MKSPRPLEPQLTEHGGELDLFQPVSLPERGAVRPEKQGTGPLVAAQTFRVGRDGACEGPRYAIAEPRQPLARLHQLLPGQTSESGVQSGHAPGVAGRSDVEAVSGGRPAGTEVDRRAFVSRGSIDDTYSAAADPRRRGVGGGKREIERHRRVRRVSAGRQRIARDERGGRLVGDGAAEALGDVPHDSQRFGIRAARGQ